MITLYPDQLELKSKVYAAWASGAQNVCMQSSTGSGKTITFCNILSEHDGKSGVIAHRSELVGQASLVLARQGIRHKIIGSDSMMRAIIANHIADTGRNWISSNAHTFIASVDTLVRMDHAKWMDDISLLIQDECFPAGTLVGDTPIEKIKVGDIVPAFNEATMRLEHKRVVRLFKNPTPKNMMRIELSTHHVLRCTQGHPFFTKRGWVPAHKLTELDEVLVNDYLLHVPEQSRFIGPSIKTIRNDRSSILFKNVLDCVSRENSFGNYGENESQVRIETNDRTKSNAQKSGSRKNESVITTNWTQTERARWQRSYRASRIGASQTDRTAWIRQSACYKNVTTKRFGLSTRIQTGFRKSIAKISYRSGWQQSRFIESTGTRRQENETLNWVRLGSVAVYQSTNNDSTGIGTEQNFVYNIEVAGLHTYVANGVVVHNCHHVLRENKWGTAARMFSNARGLYPTATPIRADGKGLGRHADGIMDVMVNGLPMRDLITLNRLSDYTIWCPQSDVDYSEVDITASGEFSLPKLRAAVHKSKQIVGDVVASYKEYAEGTLGVTFAVDVEMATALTQAYRNARIPAELITANTPEQVRAAVMRRFRKREVIQLVSVDILGEGVDVPAIETVSFARKTNSFGLYSQQFGRALRVMEGKRFARIIDHVGNVAHHNLPDIPKAWTLNRAEKRTRSTIIDDAIPLRTCLKCCKPFERVKPACPYCTTKVVPQGRASPEQVEGNMVELDLEALRKIRGEISIVDGPVRIPNNASPIIVSSIKKNHKERQDMQHKLREAMDLWGGYHRHFGREDTEIAMRFYLMFGIDVLTAQTLGRTPAEELFFRISAQLLVDGVVKAA